MQRLTDRAAIKLALGAAIQWERSLIEAYRDDLTGKVMDDPAVAESRRRIAAWRRVLARYYSDPRTESDRLDNMLAGAGSVSLMDLMRGRVPDPEITEREEQRTMAKADYRIITVNGEAVYLIDRNLGNRSVTNDAEAVVSEVLSAHPGKRIVYRDTEGGWDELHHDGSGFVRFGPWDGWVPPDSDEN